MVTFKSCFTQVPKNPSFYFANLETHPFSGIFTSPQGRQAVGCDPNNQNKVIIAIPLGSKKRNAG